MTNPMTNLFPFNPPIAPEGFPKPLSKPQTLDDITLPYLKTVISFADRLKKFIRVGHDTPDPELMMAETMVYQAQVTNYLLYKSHPDDPVFGRAPSRAPGNDPLQDTLTQIVTKLSNIDNQLKGLASDVGTLKTDVGTLKADVRTLKADVGTLKTDVGTLKTDVGTLKADVGTLKTDVGTLKTDVGTLKADVGTLKTDVGTLKTDVGTLKADVGTLKTEVGTLKKNVELLQTTSDQNKSTLTQLSSKVANLASTDEFTKAITEAISKNESIARMEHTVSAHTSKLEEIQTTVTGNSGTLARLQTSVQRIDRVQCQTFNASRNEGASWLPVRNANDQLPSEGNLPGIHRPDDLNLLSNLDILNYLEFYNYQPSTELSNKFKSTTCRNWSTETRGRFLDRLREMLVNPATSFAAILPE